MFQDRLQAAAQLADRLANYREKRPLVLAIPRGAVSMAQLIAKQLDGDFDLVLVRKLRAPGQPELAIGSVDESGWTFIAPHAHAMGVEEGYIEQEKQAQLQTIRHRRALYSPKHSPFDPAGRIVIVVDDGMATGATMLAALHGLRERKPQRLICAVPVAPEDTLRKAQTLADEVVCLETPVWFQAVGQFYHHFPQVEDAEVIELLKTRSAAARPGTGQSP